MDDPVRLLHLHCLAPGNIFLTAEGIICDQVTRTLTLTRSGRCFPTIYPSPSSQLQLSPI